MSLTKRIKEIRLVLNRPYFYTNLYPNKSVVIVFESENDDEPRFTFTGATVKGAVESAEQWIGHEKKMGSMRDKAEEKPKEEEEQKEEEPKEEESEQKEEVPESIDGK